MKKLIQKIIAKEFTNMYEWGSVMLWTMGLSVDIDRVLKNNPEFTEAYSSFTHKQPWLDEFVNYLKTYQK